MKTNERILYDFESQFNGQTSNSGKSVKVSEFAAMDAIVKDVAVASVDVRESSSILAEVTSILKL